MGGMNPVATAITMGMDVAQKGEQTRQAKQAAAAQQQQVDLQAQMLWQQQGQRAKQQRDLLKRQLATARASLAGGGIGLAGGSGQALMEGLSRRTEEDIADGHAATALRHRLQFGEDERDDGKVARGLAAARQGYQVLRSLIG